MSTVFLTLSVNFSHILSLNNSLLEEIAFKCGEDADHVRNLSQFNAAVAKCLGPLTFCLFATFNFWQLHDLYLG